MMKMQHIVVVRILWRRRIFIDRIKAKCSCYGLQNFVVFGNYDLSVTSVGTCRKCALCAGTRYFKSDFARLAVSQHVSAFVGRGQLQRKCLVLVSTGNDERPARLSVR